MPYKDKEAKRACQRRWSKKNKDKIAARMKIYTRRPEIREKLKELQRTRLKRTEVKERRRVLGRERYKDPKIKAKRNETTRKWQLQNVDRVRAKAKAYSRLHRTGYKYYSPEHQITSILKRIDEIEREQSNIDPEVGP